MRTRKIDHFQNFSEKICKADAYLLSATNSLAKCGCKETKTYTFLRETQNKIQDIIENLNPSLGLK